MLFKSFSFSLLFLLSSTAFAGLNKPTVITTGERLAGCVERKVELVDRMVNPAIRSYTKYDKHYAVLSRSSIYVDFDGENSLNILYIRNYSVQDTTSAEAAKRVLQDINASLIEPSLNICKEMLDIKEDVKFSMDYVDPAFESRKTKRVIRMNEAGQFLLP